MFKIHINIVKIYIKLNIIFYIGDYTCLLREADALHTK